MPRHNAMHVLFVAVALLAAGSASAQLSNPIDGRQPGKAQCNGLVGAWVGPQSTIVLGQDGATVVNGMKYRYTADTRIITLVGADGTFRYPYQLKGDVLNVLINGAVQTFRCGAPGTASPGAVSSGAAVPGAASQGGGISERLLLSSAWCTFSYNKITGYSNTTRWVFSPNGTYGKAGRGEGYSSGYGGTMASQHNSGGGGQWKVVNGVLYLGEGVPQPVRATVKRNSNTYAVVVVDGVEYSQCK